MWPRDREAAWPPPGGAPLCQAAFQGEREQPKGKSAGMFSRNKNGLESTKLQNARVQIPSKPLAQGGTQGLQREGGRAQVVGELRLQGNVSCIPVAFLELSQPWGKGCDPGPGPDGPPASPTPSAGYWADGREDAGTRA